MKIILKKILFLVVVAYAITILPTISVAENENTNTKLDNIWEDIGNADIPDSLKEKTAYMLTNFEYISHEEKNAPRDCALVSFDELSSTITSIAALIPEFQGLAEKSSLTKNNTKITVYELSEHSDLVTRSYNLDGEELIESVLFWTTPSGERGSGLLEQLYIEAVIRAIEPHLRDVDYASMEIGLWGDLSSSDPVSLTYLGKQYDFCTTDANMLLLVVLVEPL